MEALDGIRILFTGAADPFQKILKLTMGAGMTATLPPAFHRVGAVGGIFMVSDETKRPDEAAMRRILDRYSDSPEGIILRLAWLHGLGRKELNELTWGQVDFETGNLILPDRTVPIEESTAKCLADRYANYGAISPRVVIADRGKKPMTMENVSRLAKNALDSEGQDVALKDLRRDWIQRQIEGLGLRRPCQRHDRVQLAGNLCRRTAKKQTANRCCDIANG